MSSEQIQELQVLIQQEQGMLQDLREHMAHVVAGQSDLIDGLILGLLCDGHVLLEGLPGLAKTLSVNTLATLIDTEFQRIQFTPDLLPADVIGTLVYQPRDGEFSVKKGPIFANLVLADEINRAPAKVQSALLEAMQERQVTLGDETHPLPKPFLVLATENPIEQEGTYPLPEAQVDRFMFKVKVGYPGKEEERLILERNATTAPRPTLSAILHPDRILHARTLVDQVYMDDKIKDYILNLVFATRDPEAAGLDLAQYIRVGASPRATISLAMAAKASAFMNGRAYVTPQDVKSIAPAVLRHRILLSYEAEAEELNSDHLLQRLLSEIPVP